MSTRPRLPSTFGDSTVATRYWHRLDDGRVQCDVCPRGCKLHEGQRGLCFVRACENGEIVLTTYGRSSGFCVDPVEKKPLNHFHPGSAVLSFGTAGCNLACKFCFHPDTRIATTAGLKRIADLFESCPEKCSVHDGQIGFPAFLNVWTRLATKARVAKVFSHPYSGDLVSIKASCAPPIRLTPDHKVFAASRANPQDVRLVEAGTLASGDYLVIPKRRAGGGTVCIDVAEVLRGVERGKHSARLRRMPLEQLTAALATGTSKQIGAAFGYHPAYVRTLRSRHARGLLTAEQPRDGGVLAIGGRVTFLPERSSGAPQYLDLTPNLAWLLGLYCAEGSISADRNHPISGVLVFSFGHHEAALAERTAHLLATVFGAHPVIVDRHATVTLKVRGTATARFFEAVCGRGARDKRVPPEVAHSPPSVIRAFLDGYFAGAGYLAETQVAGNTVSRDLALGLFELGLHLDLLPSFFIHEPEPTKLSEGREASRSTTFIVKFKRDRYEGRRSESERTAWRDAGEKFLVPVRSIERIPYEGPVYNLEVDDPDHSYLAPFLAVSNCQNWDISKSRETDTLAAQATPERIAEAAKGLGCLSVAFTYNDPVIFHEYAIDVADACHARGINAVAVSAGYMCADPRKEFYQHMDAANIDLKGFTERFYHKLTGSHLAPVLETLEYLRKETQVWFEITTLLIPEENDSSEEIEAECAWIAERLGLDVPLHFTAFHPDWKLRDRPPTPPATLTRAREIALKHGLRYVYTGNVHDSHGGSTYCHHCGAMLIERDWYELGAYGLSPDGKCLACGTPCAGRFSDLPGKWGRRRLPISLALGPGAFA
jgi:pyruvate formate lyase activating enzyme